MSKPSFENIELNEFIVGATSSLINSFELFNDGALLKNWNRLSRAYTLFQLSTEEAGKVVLLLDAYTIFKISEKNKNLWTKKEIDNY